MAIVMFIARAHENIDIVDKCHRSLLYIMDLPLQFRGAAGLLAPPWNLHHHKTQWFSYPEEFKFNVYVT